jgi:hypothetical protein
MSEQTWHEAAHLVPEEVYDEGAIPGQRGESWRASARITESGAEQRGYVELSPPYPSDGSELNRLLWYAGKAEHDLDCLVEVGVAPEQDGYDLRFSRIFAETDPHISYTAAYSGNLNYRQALLFLDGMTFHASIAKKKKRR